MTRPVGGGRYSAMTMRQHMETTLENVGRGLGSWDSQTQTSLSATYDYTAAS